MLDLPELGQGGEALLLEVGGARVSLTALRINLISFAPQRLQRVILGLCREEREHDSVSGCF